MRPDRRRAGAALLEVMVAVVLLAVAGIAWIVLAGQTEKTLRDVRSREAQIRTARHAMERLTLLRAEQLQAIIGRSRFEGIEVRVVRMDDHLFSASVADTLTKGELLRTLLYPADAGSER
jgi:Tfp pilus assembly protein PilV